MMFDGGGSSMPQSLLEHSVIFFLSLFYNLPQIIGLSIILYGAFYGKYFLFDFFIFIFILMRL
jgi:hypothetical protein